MNHVIFWAATEPIDPETSTEGDPIRARLINTLVMIGLRHVAKIEILRVDPAPIATPAEEIEGILLAGYLKPSRMMY